MTVKFSNMIENNMRKGTKFIMSNFFLSLKCFQTQSAVDLSKGICRREMVKLKNENGSAKLLLKSNKL